MSTTDHGTAPRHACRVLACLTAITLSSLPTLARAQPHGDGEPGVLTSAVPAAEQAPSAAPSPSRSIGIADRGRLREAAELVASAHVRVREDRETRFGTAELVGLIQRAAARVAAESPGRRLVVGDLSAPSGGRLRPHRSHRSGRDADVGFYLVDESGQPVELPQFVRIGRSGCGQLQGARYCFDAARNWALLVALVSDTVASVQYIFIAPDIRARVLAEGERVGAPAELLERVRTVTALHAGSRVHRSHFHVRIYCPEDDRPECIDQPPYHAWYVGTPSAQPPPVVRRRPHARRRRRSR